MRKSNFSLLLFVVVLLILSISAVPALAAESVPRPVQDILDEIQKQQGVANTEAIDPQKVSQNQLETLGDAVMEVMIGDRAMHEQMDAQLGAKDQVH